jgi:hypothetical protein
MRYATVAYTGQKYVTLRYSPRKPHPDRQATTTADAKETTR